MEYEQLPVEPDKVYYYEKRYEKRPSSVVSWLGFGFALVSLLLTIYIACDIHWVIQDTLPHKEIGVVNCLMAYLIFCEPLWAVGLILSIVGLVKASNNGTPVWIGVCGLIFSALSILSISWPILVG